MRHYRTSAALSPLTLLLLATVPLAGCGGDEGSDRTETGGTGTTSGTAGGSGDTGAHVDAGGAHSGGTGDTSGASGAPAGSGGIDFEFSTPSSPCFSPEAAQLSACSSSDDAPVILAEATDVRGGGRFVTIGGGAALVEGDGDGIARYRVVQVRVEVDPDLALSEQPVQVRPLRWDDAVGEVSVLGVLGFWGGLSLPGTDTAGTQEVAVAALGCDANGCTLLAAETSEDEELVPLPDAPLPVGVRPLGLAGDQGQLCVYSETQLLCDEGAGWSVALKPEPPSPFRQVEIRGSFGMAVTEDGRLWVRRDGTWEEEAPGFESPVERVTASDWGAVAMGRNGELAVDWGSTEPAWVHHCTEEVPVLWASVAYSSTPGVAVLVMGDGSVVRTDSELDLRPWCFAGHVDIGATTGAGRDPCRSASNPILMTESVLFAPMGFACYIA